MTELLLPGAFRCEFPNKCFAVTHDGSQIPLVLAWAMSIHKSQGQTLQYVKIDLAKVFENGAASLQALLCRQ